MSYQSTQNPTPTVQVKEVGLQEQASAGKVLAVAGLAGAALAGVGALLSQKEEQPAPKSEQARDYLKSALKNAQGKDIAKMSKADRKKVAKNLKKSRKDVSKTADAAMDQARKKANESAKVARSEFSSFLSTLKDGGKDLERLGEEFAESTLMSKLKEFGEEARQIAEQGKIKSADVAEKAQSDYIPQAVEAARHASESGKERLDEVVKKAKKDYIPNAQKKSGHLQEQAHDVADKVEEEFGVARENVSAKSKEASKAVKRGGRETRSLLLWLSLAGILVFTVFLDEEQQKRLKEVAVEVFGEARDMYGDMKGDAQNN